MLSFNIMRHTPSAHLIYHYPTAFLPTGIYRLSLTCHSYRDPSLRSG